MEGAGDDEEEKCKLLCRLKEKLDFYEHRAKVLSARDECTRLLSVLSNSTPDEHNEDKCPKGEGCLLASKEKEQEDLKARFDTLEKRAMEIQDVLEQCHEFSVTENEEEAENGWKLGADMFGIKTYYHADSDGQLSLRMEGEQEIPVFEQMATLNECELYSDWIPFCSSSNLVKKISHTEQIFFLRFTTPVALRDLLVHVYATDCIMEHDCVVFVGQSVTENQMLEDKETDWPPPPSYFFGCRVDVQQLSGVIRMTSHKSAKTTILLKLDPKLSLPQMVINFVTKKMAGVFLFFLQKKSNELAEDENSSKCKHGIRMQENSEFYVEWMLPVVRAYCQYKGWEQFTVRLLGDAGKPVEGKDYELPHIEFEDPNRKSTK